MSRVVMMIGARMLHGTLHLGMIVLLGVLVMDLIGMMDLIGSLALGHIIKIERIEHMNGHAHAFCTFTCIACVRTHSH